MSVRQLADELPVSRPAVSQHLKVLAEAGLVGFQREGTRHLYHPRREGVEALRTYVETLWDDVLTAYAESSEKGEPDG